MSDRDDTVWVFDSAPADGGAPIKIGCDPPSAERLITKAPDRYRIAAADTSWPGKRSDGKPIDWSVLP